ncbi:MAG: hypothetical protein DI537_05165 [Stutzerimonas stutzeri]|nr:MAG: hypothetical protein DI537_05165 [Stutzerimonas stutzeri]
MNSLYISPAGLTGAISFIQEARSPDERREGLQALISNALTEMQGIEDAPRIYTAELEHPRHGIFKIGVDPDKLDGTTGSLLDVSLALLTSAARIAAARTIDPRSFEAETEHKAAIDRRAANFQIIGIRHTERAVRWFALGKTPDGEPFETYVSAADAQEADFQARWYATTRTERAPIQLDSLPGFLGSFYQVAIERLEPRPVELRELADATGALLELIQSLGETEAIAAITQSNAFGDVADMLTKIATAEGASQAMAAKERERQAEVTDQVVRMTPSAHEPTDQKPDLGQTQALQDHAAPDGEQRQILNIELP